MRPRAECWMEDESSDSWTRLRRKRCRVRRDKEVGSLPASDAFPSPLTNATNCVDGEVSHSDNQSQAVQKLRIRASDDFKQIFSGI